MKHIFLICTVLVLLVNTTVLSQTILFQENFNYTPGQLTTVSGGNWVNFSGTGFFIQVSAPDLSYAGYNFPGTNDGKITLTATSASAEDVNHSFASQTNTVYAAMLVKVIDTVNLAANSSSSGEYFSGFLPTADNTKYIARLSIKKGTANTFKLGIRAGSPQSVTWASAE